MYRVKFRKRVVLGEEEMLRRLNKAINQVLRDPQDYHVKDAHRIATLLMSFEYYAKRPNEAITQEKIDEITKTIDSANLVDWELTNAIRIGQQLHPLFKHVAKHENIPPEEYDLTGEVKHRFIVKESSIPNAGNGVFVQSTQKIIPGTIIGLYPGKVHLSEMFRNPEYFAALLPDPDLMLTKRLDGCVIDGRTTDFVPKNPYAISHLVNHCGKRGPNVMNVSYDYPDNRRHDLRFSTHHQRFVPNIYAKYPPEYHELTKRHFMKGMVLIACSDINDGDELLMDYRLNTKSKLLPSWYEPYDTKDSDLRWRYT